MPIRNYSSTTPVTSLTTGISDTDTTITITNYGNVWPDAPFTLLLSHDTASEEVVEVTSKNGTNNFFTIIRGVDGTTPQSHAAGAEAVHGVSARDFSESNSHANATNSVHGIADTSALETVTGSQTKADAAVSGHSSVTLSVHGIADTSDLVVSADIADLVAGSGVTDIVSLTQAEYDALTPVATTLYLITD